MATTDYSLKIKTLNDKENQLRTKLRTSITAYSPGGAPSAADLATQADLLRTIQQRDALQGQQVKERWYGTDTSEVPKKKQISLLKNALDLLGAPIYGMTGLAESALGKSAKPNVVENVISNMFERRETFSDLLRKEGLPNIISMPLGLVLDITLDPFAGSLGGVSKLYKASKVAGLVGAETVLKKAGFTAASAIPFIGKESKQNLLSKAATLAEKYRDITGETVEQLSTPGLFTRGIQGGWKAVREKTEGTKFGSILDAITPQPKEWEDIMRRMDEVRREPSYVGTPEAALDALDNFFKKADEEYAGFKMPKTPFEHDQVEVAKDIKRGIDMATEEGGLVGTANVDKFRRELESSVAQSEFERDFAERLYRIMEDKTGVKLYDDLTDAFKSFKVGNVEIGRKIANAYEYAQKIFKSGVTGGSPRYPIMSSVSNMAFRQGAGLKTWTPEYLGSLNDAFKLAFGNIKGDNTRLVNFINDPKIRSFIEQNPSLFTSTYAIKPAEFLNLGKVRAIVEKGIEEVVPKGKKAESTKMLLKEMAEKQLNYNRKEVRDTMSIMKNIFGDGKRIVDLPEGDVIRTIDNITGNITPASVDELPSTFFAGEIYRPGSELSKQMNKIAKAIKIEAEGGKSVPLPTKIFYQYMMLAGEMSSKPDQIFKLSDFIHLTQNGIDLDELGKLRSFIDINIAKDTKKVAGKELWKLTPEAATRATNEIYMNYQTLPKAIKVLRSIPFIGQPFASFSYLMGVKAGKTALYNPSAINRIQFFMNDFSGGRSPQERQAIAGEGPMGKYYQYLGKEGMMRLPFFEQNPVYVNFGSMIPYFTLNMIQDPERYKDIQQKTLGADIFRVIDQSPFFKTPEGQWALDYLIQPMIIRDSQPKGMFDQPLYPAKATTAEKIFYASRAVAEPFFPGMLSMTGLAGGLLPEQAIEAVPSYRWRQLARATKGETVVGAPSSEDKGIRTLRTASAIFGIPWYQMKLYQKK